jgi:hypothetical protein
MTAEQRRLREDLTALAGSARGRRLLQFALRGIERGERAVTAGCWTERGVAGCLFQHAYWEGVREGVFADAGRPGDWIGSFVGGHDYGLVIRAIESFDLLARAAYADVQRRRLLPDRVHVRHEAWNAAVAGMLIDTLGGTPAPASPSASQVAAGL